VSKFCGAHRAPRAGVDPIVDAGGALDVVQLAMSSPPTEETIVVVLDEDHRGRTVVVVDGTNDDDAVLEVVERVAASMAGAPDGPGAMVVASIRIGRGPSAADGDRWLEASDLAEDAGVELLEWFVVQADGDAIVATCPRDLLAEAPRWRSR
jgi:hypothetical protein